MLDYRIDTFLTLCESMNYRKAAEILHISQPAVTQQIHYLENQYGRKLFQYENRRLVKTEAAVVLEKYARAAKLQEQDLKQKLENNPVRTLRIGATKTIGDYILGPAIRRFLDAPDHQLQFLVDNTAALLRRLEQGELDFVVLEGVFNKARYDSFLLRNEPYIGICPPGHPLDGQTVSPEALLGQRLILREEGSGTRDLLERSLAQCGYTVGTFSGTVCVSSFKIIRELVCAGYGISFVYAAVAADLPAPGRFFCPPLTGSHELNAVWLKGTDAGALARAFAAGL